MQSTNNLKSNLLLRKFRCNKKNFSLRLSEYESDKLNALVEQSIVKEKCTATKSSLIIALITDKHISSIVDKKASSTFIINMNLLKQAALAFNSNNFKLEINTSLSLLKEAIKIYKTKNIKRNIYKVNESLNKTIYNHERININLTLEEHAILIEKASKNNLTLAYYLRQLIIKKEIYSKFKIEDIVLLNKLASNIKQAINSKKNNEISNNNHNIVEIINGYKKLLQDILDSFKDEQYNDSKTKKENKKDTKQF